MEERSPAIEASRARTVLAGARDAIEVLAGDFLIQQDDDPDIVLRQSIVLFFRLTVLELGRRLRRLPDDGWQDGDLSWDALQARFDGMDHRFRSRDGGGSEPYRGLFSRDGLAGENSFLAKRAPSDGSLQASLKAARSVAGWGDPHEVLSRTYEHLLGFSLVHEDRHRGVLQPAGRHRKDHGIFFTPARIAAAAIAPAVRHARGGSKPAVLDPTMGTGAFLQAAVRFLAAETRADPAFLAERCVYGVDADPLAVELGILALWLETGARPVVLAHHLRHGDLLRSDAGLGDQNFQAVVGNPPWGARYTPEEQERLAQRFPCSTRGSFDSFKLFLDLASTRTIGTVGMVVPQAVLTQDRHADIRSLLLERLDPYLAADLGDRLFPRAAAPAALLVFGPKPGPEAISISTSRNPRFSDRQSATIPARLWSSRAFPVQRSELVEMLHRLQRDHPTLGSLSSLYRVRDVGINYNRAAIARRILYEGAHPEDPRDLRRYRGRCFARYTAIRAGGWVRHDARARLEPREKLSLDWNTYRLPEKLVFRQTADRPIATLDRSGMAMGRSVIAITREGAPPLQPLLACLNSSLLTALYRAAAGEAGRILPQVKVGRITALPFPAICTQTQPGTGPISNDIATYATLVQNPGDNLDILCHMLHYLAEHLLTNHGEDPVADALIDRIVYRLYGLTPEEIALVEESQQPRRESHPISTASIAKQC